MPFWQPYCLTSHWSLAASFAPWYSLPRSQCFLWREKKKWTKNKCGYRHSHVCANLEEWFGTGQKRTGVWPWPVNVNLHLEQGQLWNCSFLLCLLGCVLIKAGWTSLSHGLIPCFWLSFVVHMTRLVCTEPQLGPGESGGKSLWEYFPNHFVQMPSAHCGKNGDCRMVGLGACLFNFFAASCFFVGYVVDQTCI